MVTVMLLSLLMVSASNTSFLIDVSGSMNGLSKDRSVKSLAKVRNELGMYMEGNSKDSVQIITFTDRIVDNFIITPSSTNLESVFKTISFPRKGNTNLEVALESVDAKFNRIVVISDGRHNIGDASQIIAKLTTNKESANKKQYFLLLDEKDMETPLIKEFSNSNYIAIISSLSDLKEENPTSPAVTTQAETTSSSIVKTNANNSSKDESEINLFQIIIWIIVCSVILVLGILLIKILVPVLPLFKMVSAGAIQKAIPFLYNLPKPLFNIIFKVLPSKMKSFLKEYMPSYNGYSRGNVIPKNDTQKQTLDEWEKQTGKRAKYKNGEIDFSDVAEHKERLNGTLDNNIPNGANPRANVSHAQDCAANQMLNSKTGREKIAKYLGKNPNDITYEDYTSWKDDSLNQGKPNHNPKTPHESIDGREIMWVPKRFHDVAWGGISHNGGVSMLKSIRTYFGLNI